MLLSNIITILNIALYFPYESTKKMRFEFHQTDTTRSQSAVIDVHGANSHAAWQQAS